VNLDGADYPQTGPFPERDPFYAWGVTSGLRVNVTDGWTVRAAGGRKSRFPTMRELFGAAIGKFIPNPNLKPVTAWIGEAGVQRRWSSVVVDATAFLNRVYDTIDKRSFTQGIIDDENLPSSYLGKEQRINLEGARVFGFETSVRWTPTEAFEVNGNVTWSRPRGFKEDGDVQRLDEKPAWLGTGSATYDLSFGLSLTGQARYVGGVYARNNQNEFVSLSSSPSLVLDTRLSYELSRLAESVDGKVYLRGDNLTDEAVFVGLGLPRPGRSFQVGVEVTL
jgi:iron complex outermembrane receptor protein